MHLFEAALAWLAMDGDPAWRSMADELANLCLNRLIDPATGALREHFADDWSPARGVAGSIIEPGHQYEWAFLLHRWAALTRMEPPPAITRMIEFADSHGTDPGRRAAINAVRLDGSMHDETARLWAQAERIRAYIIAGDLPSSARLAEAIRGLRRFLETPVSGLWFDQWTNEDEFVDEPARATSLYHIVGAAAELICAMPSRPMLIAEPSFALEPDRSQRGTSER
jgi:mannose-6-phosphate isomerase